MTTVDQTAPMKPVDQGHLEDLGQSDETYKGGRADGKVWANEGDSPKYTSKDTVEVIVEELTQCADLWESEINSHFDLVERELRDMKKLRPGNFPDGTSYTEKFETWLRDASDRAAGMYKLHKDSTRVLRETIERCRTTEDDNLSIAGSAGGYGHPPKAVPADEGDQPGHDPITVPAGEGDPPSAAASPEPPPEGDPPSTPPEP